MEEIKMIDLKIGKNLQQQLDIEEWAKKERSKILMIPKSFITNEEERK